MGDDEPVSLLDQVRQRSVGLARIEELLADVAFLVFLSDRVATKRRDDQFVISHISEPQKT